MRRKIMKILISVFFLLIISMGAATWILSGVNQNSNSIDHALDSNIVDVNVHYTTQSAETTTTTEFFIPKTFTIDHNLTYYDKNGNTSESILSSSGDVTVKDPDPLLIYYDVNNGTYTKIDQRSQSKGPEQIKSFSVNVTEWESVFDSSSYSDVWNITVDHPSQNNYRLRFEEDSGNSLTGHGHKYSIGDVYKDDEVVSSITEEIGNSIITTTIYQRIVVDNNDVIEYGSSGSGCTAIPYNKWVYYAKFQQRMIRITQTSSEPVESDTVNTISVKKGSKLSTFDLGIDDYVNYGYYADAEYSTYFDFSNPINNATDIYLRYISGSEGLSNTITNMTTSGSTLTLYDQYLGGSNGTTDISLDASYHNPTNSVFANSFTINSGVSVNLTYSTALSYTDPIEGMIPSDGLGAHRSSTDNSVAEDYDGATYIGDANKSIHFILNGDVTVKGSLVVGAEIGGHTGSACYSIIIGKYAVLDLYGHTITVDGGNIKAYGIIKDSVGGGKIIIKNGGSVTGTMTVSDGRGRDPSALGVSKRQSPFTEYRLSYLQVPVYLYNGTTLNGYLKADFAQFGVINLTIPFLGNTFNSYLFSWDSNTSDNYVMYEPYKIDQIATQGNTTIYKSMYYLRNKFVFNANIREASELIVEARVDSVAGEVNIAIDFARIDVPISPFFDIILKSGYTMELNSKLTLYPGSYFYAEKGSTIYFNFAGNKTYAAISKAYGNMGINIPGETRYISGGIMTYTNRIQDIATNSYSTFNIGVYNATTYWDYVKESLAIIDGDIIFNENIDTTKSDGFYYLSGNVQLSDSALTSIVGNKNYVKTYDFKSELKTLFLYSSTNYSLDKQYALATSYNINPLISGDSAFIIDKDYCMYGTYNENTGVFTDSSNQKMYFLKTDTDMYEEGSSGSNQSSKIDRNITITEVSKSYETYKILKDVSGTSYLNYCGLLVPIVTTLPDTISFANNSEININARKFMSNANADFTVNIRTITINDDGSTTTSSAVSTNVAGCFSNVTVRYSTSTKQWKYYCFGDYPKTGTGTRYSY